MEPVGRNSCVMRMAPPGVIFVNEKLVETILGVLIVTLAGLLGWILTQVLKMKDQMIVLRKQRIELGAVEMPENKPELWDEQRWAFPASHDRSNDRREEVKVEVTFKQKFRATPRVEVALAKVDLGDARASVHRVEVEAKRPTPEGFVLYFRTWSQSLLFDATAIWIAVAEDPLSWQGKEPPSE
jgi:hypothetical protein